MKAKELEQAQQKLNDKVYEIAEVKGLINDDVDPITDGVYDAEKYLNSVKRVMWIMKEPYDDIINGKPRGGDWNLAKECFAKNDAWSCKSWQPIIYAMYGLKNGLLRDDMKNIREDKSMADVLQEIAFINVSKMPNLSHSDNGHLAECYTIWKPLLFEQFTIYDPEVLVFCSTFKFFKNDFLPELQSIGEVVYDKYKVGEAYRWKGKLVLSVLHPNNRSVKVRVYVNSIIEAIQKS